MSFQGQKTAKNGRKSLSFARDQLLKLFLKVSFSRIEARASGKSRASNLSIKSLTLYH